ncbi:MAG: 3-oxoacyl-ACP reductase FabG [Spirochaetia bacterium]|jgi:3-oxoacyl-[acyl-carrier protein] reductase
MKDLVQRVAIVTGASRGIGRAIALCLAEEGCTVVVNYRSSAAAAEEVAAEAARRSQAASFAFAADVTSETEVTAMVRETERQFGRIDILVNNAAISQHLRFLDIAPQDWTRMIEGNLGSVYLCCRAVLPVMMRRESGRIINISSTSGITGGTSGAHYAAAKGGVISFTKALSSEFAPRGITVNAIVPSKIETDMLREALDEKAREELKRRIPVRRLGTPEEIGALAAFLASDRAGYITGEMLVASGGYR